ncbi:hypothetical protein MSM1_16020 [Mycobacterium sp. SM1]|uniref:hypothetical protein n=1 Tax=Mycobacterium sp. SM1 TaxID=2816243 RepID=UPI001BCDA236|nr:hypothetical protein [Mycobacterium sp. SM1]MBS4729786.1 hypothetical protein [Mycobacterium sp. SM1]
MQFVEQGAAAVLAQLCSVEHVANRRPAPGERNEKHSTSAAETKKFTKRLRWPTGFRP